MSVKYCEMQGLRIMVDKGIGMFQVSRYQSYDSNPYWRIEENLFKFCMWVKDHGSSSDNSFYLQIRRNVATESTRSTTNPLVFWSIFAG